MKKIAIWLLISLTISCTSTTTYKPSIYGHDYVRREIVTPVTHVRISTGDKEFNNYVSFSLDDYAKVALLIKNAELPLDIRIILEKFDKEVNKIKNKQKEN